jgi:hypothetical protein
LHCLVLADTDEKVTHCVRLINRVIETVSNDLYPAYAVHIHAIADRRFQF